MAVAEGEVMGTTHFWTGSRYACGIRDAESSTEAPGWVRCKRCLPAARKAEREMNAEDDARRGKSDAP